MKRKWERSKCVAVLKMCVCVLRVGADVKRAAVHLFAACFQMLCVRVRDGSTYCHAMERQLPVHFELIGRHHPSTCVYDDVVKLLQERQREGKNEYAKISRK